MPPIAATPASAATAQRAGVAAEAPEPMTEGALAAALLRVVAAGRALRA